MVFVSISVALHPCDNSRSYIGHSGFPTSLLGFRECFVFVKTVSAGPITESSGQLLADCHSRPGVQQTCNGLQIRCRQDLRWVLHETCGPGWAYWYTAAAQCRHQKGRRGKNPWNAYHEPRKGAYWTAEESNSDHRRVLSDPGTEDTAGYNHRGRNRATRNYSVHWLFYARSKPFKMFKGVGNNFNVKEFPAHIFLSRRK